MFGEHASKQAKQAKVVFTSVYIVLFLSLSLSVDDFFMPRYAGLSSFILSPIMQINTSRTVRRPQNNHAF
jgi:hypothetical protein